MSKSNKKVKQSMRDYLKHHYCCYDIEFGSDWTPSKGHHAAVWAWYEPCGAPDSEWSERKIGGKVSIKGSEM